MSRKVLSWLLTAAMALSLFSGLTPKASAAVDGDWTYTLYDGNTTAAITGYTGTGTSITIPPTIAGVPVTRIGSNAFMDNTQILSVTVPDSVLRIESGAFQNSALTSVDLGEGVTYIGQYAFNGTYLTSVTIPNSVETIDFSAFALSALLAEINIVGNNLTSLVAGAFSGTAITEIRIPTSLSAINMYTFQNCTELTSVTIPDNISSIDYYAFGGCSSLSSATFEGNAPATMGNYVFNGAADGFTIYYYTGATGFTTPTWTTGQETYDTVVLDAPAEAVTLDIAGGSIVIKPEAYDFGGSTNIANPGNSYIITQTGPESPTVNTITVQDGADVSISINGINISAAGCAFALSGDSSVDLALSGSNFLTSGVNRAGLEVPSGSELIISGALDDSLDISGGEYAAGLGGGYSVTPANAGTITINGGVIRSSGGTAAGGTGSGAGIGGGRGGSGGTITIDGGDVTATGGYRASGIGGGTGGTSGTILIQDGDITALSGDHSAGIGSGYNCPIDSITIEGGTIHATGTSDGAGIGTGRIQDNPSPTYTNGGTINISGGDITAIASGNASGIGGGLLLYISYVLPMTINITGGIIEAAGYSGPGIGSNEGTINISGGEITASSGHNSAGIGGSYRRSGGTINITDGTVTATGAASSGGAGIGGGHPHENDNLSGSIINISGGDITATGGEYGAGIGGGYATTAGEITITGGIITAHGTGGSAIGIGLIGNGGKIIISQATINVSDGDVYSNDAISAGTDGTIHIGFTGVPGPDSWVCDPLDTRAEVTLTDTTLSENGLLFGTCLITGAGNLDGLYIEGVKQAVPYASEVVITGSPVTGETLTGEYSFNGTSESGTTYKWLAESGTDSAIFSTMNIAGVDNDPSAPAEFVLSEPTLISRIENYHWNYGSGTLPGTIALQEAGGTLYGPWDAVGIAGNLYWEVRPYVELPAGTYTIIDSSDETWANNSESGFRGMTTVSTANYSNDFTPIDGATEQSYLLSSDDLGKMIQFEVTVSDADGLIGSPVGSSSVGPVTMAVAPDPVPGTIQFEAGGYGTYEGYNGWISVERIDGSDGIVSVEYATADETAIAGIHYTSFSGTLTWSDGDDEVKVIPCVIADDSQYNGYLYLTYTLSNPTGGAELGSQNPLTVGLSDNDNPPTPTGLTASAGNGEVTLEWDEVNSAYYKLYWSPTQDGFTEENSVGIYDGTSYKKTGLTNGTTYYFAVKSGHNIYYSELTNTISATPIAPSSYDGGTLSPPTILVVTREKDDSTTNSTEISSFAVSGTAFAAVSTAVVNALLDKISSAGGGGRDDLIEVAVDTQDNIDGLTLSILQSDLETIADATDAGFAITSPFISVTFDGKALETISGAASGGTVVITAGVVDSGALSDEDREKVQGRPVYAFSVTNGGHLVSDFAGGSATVTIPYSLQPGEDPNAVVVYYLADDGALQSVSGQYDAETGSVVFTTPHFSEFVIGYNRIVFSDVAPGAWYENAVTFLAARGITSGTGTGRFSPENALTRGQFIVLLLRAYGIAPAEDSSDNFADAGNTWYTGYLAAAKDLGISNGIGSNLFAPEAEISRQELFTLLYRTLVALGALPEGTTGRSLSDFSDQAEIAPYAREAMTALVERGVVAGSAGKLDPLDASTRAQMAQVLYTLLSR